MDRRHPVYTVTTECQDCNKCVRQCPVKAIRVRDGHAEVIPERCVACGHCVKVCPARAKRIRDDVGRARRLVDGPRPVWVSLAPSWVSELPDLSPPQMIAALQALGFAGAGETALGAQEVSAATAAHLQAHPDELWLSSACPAAVAFVSRYLPAYHGRITPLASPLMAHADLLRKAAGEEIAVVFIGPCVAKKLEADAHPDRVQLALTFRELAAWWDEAGVDPHSLPAAGTPGFFPRAAEEGALYPLVGGMGQTLRCAGLPEESQVLDVAGLRAIDTLLADPAEAAIAESVFVECLACEGGCIKGPCMSAAGQGLASALEVRKRARVPAEAPRRAVTAAVEVPVACPERAEAGPGEEALREALLQVGKESIADELNCGGCGYDTCRHFAAALLEGNAEPAMCVSHMRRIAQRKANALLRCMPAGVVIADEDLRVVECNRAFATVFGPEAVAAFEASPGLAGARLQKLLPFAELFAACLRSGEDIRRSHMPVGDRLLEVVIFSIEPGRIVGAVVQDVTETEMRREQIARRAGDVIQKNLQAVQEIACRLGEHMADTEMLLSSIAEDYGPAGLEAPERTPDGDRQRRTA